MINVKADSHGGVGDFVLLNNGLWGSITKLSVTLSSKLLNMWSNRNAFKQWNVTAM